MPLVYNFCLYFAILIAFLGVTLAASNANASVQFAHDQMESFRSSPKFVLGTSRLLDIATIEATLRTYWDLHEEGVKFESEHVIAAFSIVSCSFCSDSEVSVVHKNEKILILTQTIAADFIFNVECSFVSSDHPPFYSRFDDGNKRDNVIINWAAVVKCSPFDANDFAIMKNDTIFEELFPNPEFIYRSPPKPSPPPIISRETIIVSLVLVCCFIILSLACYLGCCCRCGTQERRRRNNLHDSGSY